MSYVVLARRWRPKHFAEVVGQQHVARTLENAIAQDRVAHAFLFCGPRGVGKTSTARILAKALNCHQGPTATPCYDCPSCNEINDGASMDVIEIDGASNRGVGEIRELREAVRYAPGRDRHKIYIIDEVHMLTTEAFNALLKTLEEPPPHVKFIFATTEPQKIPVTILSRCQRFDFKRIPRRQIADRLAEIAKAEELTIEESALLLIARQADGGMRDALSLTDQVTSFCSGDITEAEVAEILGIAGRGTLFRLSGAVLERRVEDALLVLDEVNQAGYDLMNFAASWVSHLRDLALVKSAQRPEALTDLTGDEVAVARRQVEPIALATLARMFQVMVSAADEMSHSAFPKLMFEMTLVKLACIEPLVPFEPLLKRLEALEHGVLIGEGTPPVPTPTSGAAGAGGPSSGAAGNEPAEPPSSAKRASSPSGTSAGASAAQPSANVEQPPSATPSSAPSETSSTPSKPQQLTATAQEPTTPKNGVPRAKPAKDAAKARPVSQQASPDDKRKDSPPEVEEELVGDEPDWLNEGPPPLGELAAEKSLTPAPEQPPAAEADKPRQTKGVPPQVPANASSPAPETTPEPTPEDVMVPGLLTLVGTPKVEPEQPPTPRPPVGDPLPDERARTVWKAIVEYLRPKRPMVAELFQQAAIEGIAPGRARIQFDTSLTGIANQADYLGAVSDAAGRVHEKLYDAPWAIEVSFTDELPTDELHRTLAAEHREALEARRQAARNLIANHALVTEATKIFSPVSMHVVLDDDDASL